MPRRYHRKSRNGCQRCKQRHIKCDENRPRCVNCITVKIRCSFEDTTAPRLSSSRWVSHHTDDSTDGYGTSNPSSSRGQSPQKKTVTSPDLNLEQLELLHHWMTKTHLTFVNHDAQKEIWNTLIVQEGLRYPFLLQQLLAVSAVHLAITKPSRSAHYHNRAIEFQTSAMTGFHALEGRIDENSCVAVLMFSGLIAIHVLADRSQIEKIDNNSFIDHFLRCLRLMQAVGGVVLDKWWSTMRNRPELLALSDTPHTRQQRSQASKHINQLKPLLLNPELNHQAVAAYGSAIDSLESMYATSGVPHKTFRTIHPILAWTVKLSPNYLDLIAARKPEALIILAYYAAFLNFHEQSWVTGNSGSRLLESINDNLDEDWRRWISWPNEITRVAEDINASYGTS